MHGHGLFALRGLAVLIIGVPFFLLFIGTARVLALAEGRIVESMLGMRMPRRPVHPGRAGDSGPNASSRCSRIRARGARCCTSVLMLPLGIFYFTFAVVGIVVSMALFIAPIVVLLHLRGRHHDRRHGRAGPHPALLPLISILGIVLLTVTMHLSRGIGYLHGQLAKFLLVRPAPDGG